MNASGLWTIMKQEANQHLLYRDLDNPIIDNSSTIPYVTYDRRYDAGSQTFFDKQIRQALGLAVDGTEYIDIDSYDPSTFSLDMFSADELYNTGNALVSYYGYDHRGNKLIGKQSLQDFFAGVDGNRNIGAWEPIYAAGYVQDKFLFRDLIFNIGLRVDRFDGNQMGLKDPYTLYSSYTAGELRAAGRTDIPNGIGDGYVVYVDKLSSSTTVDNVEIRGYRNASENAWYTANGELVSNPDDVAGASGQPLPYRKGTLTETGLPTQISTDAFEDYKPQYVAMPRVAFSFPVSDKSEFKASYDVIARRPSEGAWQANYAGYLFMEKMNGAVFTNPNLKPEKGDVWTLGANTKINDKTNLSGSIYYSEIDDAIAWYSPNPNDQSVPWSVENVNREKRRGLEVSIDHEFDEHLTGYASYTYMQIKQDKGNGSSCGSDKNCGGQQAANNPFDIKSPCHYYF